MIQQTKLSLDFTDSDSGPVLMTHLKVFETHACTIYIRAMFRTVRSEIVKEMYFFMNDKKDQMGRHILHCLQM